MQNSRPLRTAAGDWRFRPECDRDASRGTCSRPSEDPNRLLFDRRPDVLGQAIARAIADFPTRNGLPDHFVGSDEMIEAVKVVGARIDKDINVRILTRLVARIGAEQVQRLYPVRPQLRLDGLELGDDFIAVHSQFYRGDASWKSLMPHSGYIVLVDESRVAGGTDGVHTP